jgi:hypothetical protein
MHDAEISALIDFDTGTWDLRDRDVVETEIMPMRMATQLNSSKQVDAVKQWRDFGLTDNPIVLVNRLQIGF